MGWVVGRRLVILLAGEFCNKNCVRHAAAAGAAATTLDRNNKHIVVDKYKKRSARCVLFYAYVKLQTAQPPSPPPPPLHRVHRKVCDMCR